MLTHKAKWFLKFDNEFAMSCLWHIYDRLWWIGLSSCHKDISNNVMFTL